MFASRAVSSLFWFISFESFSSFSILISIPAKSSAVADSTTSFTLFWLTFSPFMLYLLTFIKPGACVTAAIGAPPIPAIPSTIISLASISLPSIAKPAASPAAPPIISPTPSAAFPATLAATPLAVDVAPFLIAPDTAPAAPPDKAVAIPSIAPIVIPLAREVFLISENFSSSDKSVLTFSALKAIFSSPNFSCTLLANVIKDSLKAFAPPI